MRGGGENERSREPEKDVNIHMQMIQSSELSSSREPEKDVNRKIWQRASKRAGVPESLRRM